MVSNFVEVLGLVSLVWDTGIRLDLTAINLEPAGLSDYVSISDGHHSFDLRRNVGCLSPAGIANLNLINLVPA